MNRSTDQIIEQVAGIQAGSGFHLTDADTAAIGRVLRGETLDVEPNFGASGGLFTNDGYGMLTVGGAWTLRGALSVQARVVNALGADYEDVFGYPALGRTLYAGIRVAARR